LSGSHSNQGYGQEAAGLLQRYESIRFDDLHGDVMHMFPAPPARVLDIGAGTGRDAAALARRGYRVTAAEPTAELREEGRILHALQAIDWVDDALPTLPRLTERGERFDLILLTAVWMHLDASERHDGMATLTRLVAPGSQIIMTLRHGPVPHGRRMFEVSGAETAALATQAGFQVNLLASRQDTQQRADVSWTVVGLKPRQV
jgi:2-polyprenyl-3-methyl-5-hydroxy-6-metoxy-1,4-benzoquinol methylase